MKKIIVLLAVLALCAGSAWAIVIDDDSAPVTLTIEPWAFIWYNVPSTFGLTISSYSWCSTHGLMEGFTAPITTGYHAGANYAAAITYLLTPPTGAPGEWTGSNDLTAVGPGEGYGTVGVEVDHVPLSAGNLDYTTGGSMVIQISSP